jgi:hypothetical protein
MKPSGAVGNRVSYTRTNFHFSRQRVGRLLADFLVQSLKNQNFLMKIVTPFERVGKTAQVDVLISAICF